MKRIYIAAALLASFAVTSAFSQNEDPRGTFSLGPAVGFGHAGVTGVGYDDLFKASYNAGLTMNYSTMEHVGFSADVLYSLEGARWQTNNGSEVDLSLHYLRIPLKFAYFFGDVQNSFRPKITIGPSFGFMIDHNMDLEDAGTNRNNLPNDSEFQKFDLGANGSIGFNQRLAERIWLNVDAYYYRGFIQLDGTGRYNSNFGLRAGVAFGFAK